MPKPLPQKITLSGRYVRLEPLVSAHSEGLFAACSGSTTGERFTWLPDASPTEIADMQTWVNDRSKSVDPLFFVVIDHATGKVGGRQALMRITPAHGVIEVGGIYWGPAIARTRIATEALYLFARYVFEDLGYRRLEWKCDDRNEASKQAALRFGFQFEGVFRQHMWVKDQNRDTAWFAILDHQWAGLKCAYEKWLDPLNFDEQGLQQTKLASIKTS